MFKIGQTVVYSPPEDIYSQMPHSFRQKIGKRAKILKIVGMDSQLLYIEFEDGTRHELLATRFKLAGGQKTHPLTNIFK